MPRSDVIREAKESVSIVNLVARYAETAIPYRSGWASLCCPFHSDRNDSASISASKGRFVCHRGCVSGDVIDVAKHAEGFKSPIEAARWLLRTFGMKIKSSETQRLLPGSRIEL